MTRALIAKQRRRWPVALPADDREDDFVTNTGRGSDLLDAVTGVE